MSGVAMAADIYLLLLTRLRIVRASVSVTICLSLVLWETQASGLVCDNLSWRIGNGYDGGEIIEKSLVMITARVTVAPFSRVMVTTTNDGLPGEYGYAQFCGVDGPKDPQQTQDAAPLKGQFALWIVWPTRL
ncbi:hypothetical protein FPQ18DRAFT_301734 [Pyronema domesticum]|uniref:Uncharacterized protein n=1 Tax=Pyronema omphalodes (strain CBS 100304) TaxID=1076935 RepID=U4KZX4_PYROM|nr:hypothetical protein FPQ18DRAFT_301734 [Pyronema domesticum]CCX07779.1 Protein of unknown function [Pyronema omphalodes CBS 100304]